MDTSVFSGCSTCNSPGHLAPSLPRSVRASAFEVAINPVVLGELNCVPVQARQLFDELDLSFVRFDPVAASYMLHRSCLDTHVVSARCAILYSVLTRRFQYAGNKPLIPLFRTGRCARSARPLPPLQIHRAPRPCGCYARPCRCGSRGHGYRERLSTHRK